MTLKVTAPLSPKGKLQPFYNSGTTAPIATISSPLDSAYAISSAVWKMVTLDDLGDLQRSRGHFTLVQPSYNSETTGLIAMISSPFESAYAISSAVSKMVTLGDLYDLK